MLIFKGGCTVGPLVIIYKSALLYSHVMSTYVEWSIMLGYVPSHRPIHPLNLEHIVTCSHALNWDRSKSIVEFSIGMNWND